VDAAAARLAASSFSESSGNFQWLLWSFCDIQSAKRLTIYFLWIIMLIFMLIFINLQGVNILQHLFHSRILSLFFKQHFFIRIFIKIFNSLFFHHHPIDWTCRGNDLIFIL
jgi:hypothetical protein